MKLFVVICILAQRCHHKVQRYGEGNHFKQSAAKAISWQRYRDIVFSQKTRVHRTTVSKTC